MEEFFHKSESFFWFHTIFYDFSGFWFPVLFRFVSEEKNKREKDIVNDIFYILFP